MPGAPVTIAGNGVGFTSGTISIGSSSAAIVGNNPQRQGIIIQNIHASQTCDVTIATTSTKPGGGGMDVPTAPTAASGSGFRLLAAGANYLYLPGYTGPIAGYASGASTTILVTEW